MARLKEFMDALVMSDPALSERMDGSLLIPMCKNSKLKATTTTTISNSDNLSLGVSSLAS